MTLEDWNTFFQFASAVALLFTFAAGVGALLTGYIVGKRQTERIAIAEEGTAKALADAAAATERTKSIESQTAQYQARAAEAEKEVLKLRERIQPRRLTSEQREKLIAFLRPLQKGPLVVRSVIGDGEGNAFAEELAAVFIAAGYSLEGGVRHSAYTGGNPRGLITFVRDRKIAPHFSAREN